MVRKRSVFDPLEPTATPRWYVVRNSKGSVVESRLLAGGTDLKRFFIAQMLGWTDADWTIGEFTSRSGTFFCTRGNERRQISISPSDPGKDLPSLYGPFTLGR